MSVKYSGGCDHIYTHSDNEPIDVHTCHCSVCKNVTGQDTTHVAFFNHTDLEVDDLGNLNRQPFNEKNPEDHWSCALVQLVALPSCLMINNAESERLCRI